MEQGKGRGKECFFLNSFYRPSRQLCLKVELIQKESRDGKFFSAQTPFPCQCVQSLAQLSSPLAWAFTLFCQ